MGMSPFTPVDQLRTLRAKIEVFSVDVKKEMTEVVSKTEAQKILRTAEFSSRKKEVGKQPHTGMINLTIPHKLPRLSNA